MLELKREKCEVIVLHINLFDRGMNVCYEAAKKNGFFFTGCMPMSEEGDYILMELFIDSMVNYEELVVVPQFLELFETVKSLDPDVL